VAVSMGERVALDAAPPSQVDGRSFRFSTAEAKAMFYADPATVVRKADANWSRSK
jgi:hypothetical protein